MLRAPLILVVAVLLALAWGAPLVGAAGSEAAVEPAMATAGEPLKLIFTADDSGTVDVGVQRSATCEITGPDGAKVDCTSASTLVVARVTPAVTSYAWTLPAPSAEGNYTVSFAETSLVSLTPAKTASATFHVAAGTLQSAALGSPAGQSGTQGPPASATTQSASSAASSPAARWLFVSTVGSGAILTLLVTLRQGR